MPAAGGAVDAVVGAGEWIQRESMLGRLLPFLMASEAVRTRHEQLRDFLRGRRERLTPEDVGMSSVGRRRTPGLRREEVAVLAGVGVSWYTWLEQGRDITVSAEVLDAVARALLLNAAERGHLYLLAGLNPPPAGELGGGEVTPQVRQLLDAWEQRPALLRDRYWNVLACNDDGKIALITGGTSGIGLATARRLLAEGAQVVITGRDRTRLNEVAEELGDRVLGIAGDAANLTDLETLTAAIRDRHGRLDVVFANAGTGAFQAIDEVTEDEFHRVVDINLKSVFFTVQKSLPLLPTERRSLSTPRSPCTAAPRTPRFTPPPRRPCTLLPAPSQPNSPQGESG